ncbi:neuraminidase-like domain-containing protein [Paenibacillus glycanilyticus]|uniref:neuraminidase-like domain-containing protein n=1 Tax=Paenibacillus glycanilyticus TaxID=126569 RepID=UPI000FD78AA4|nr:neuraminidase-like domain-containing protein [Paenibacillus glycanilyticus]
MNKIIFPLKPGDRSPEVGDLQDALQLFLDKAIIMSGNDSFRQELAAMMQQERVDQVYKDGTIKLVSIFQEERHLADSGVVDETTAAAINEILQELGVLNEGLAQLADALKAQVQTLNSINAGTDHLASIDEKIGSLGRAAARLSLNMQGEAVRDLHAKLVSLGATLPAGETESGIFGVGTRDVLLQLQAKFDLAQTGVLDDGTRNALLTAVGGTVLPRRVEGRIFLENGLPAAKITLRIVNKGFGEDETLLGEIETDDQGFYVLPYDLDNSAAHIEVRTVDSDLQEVRLSIPKFNADRYEVLNLVAPSFIKSQTNEFLLMTGDLGKIIGEDPGKLARAQEKGNNYDLSMLNESTNWDARLIARAASAAKLSTITGIRHDALYGAIRAGLPDDPEALAMVTPEAFATALTRAHEAGVITLNMDQITLAARSFEAFALAARRKMIVPGALSSIGDMLDKLNLEQTHKDEFEKLLMKYDGDDEQLWREAKNKSIPIADLQLQGKLAYLTLNNAPLTESLMNEIGSQENLAHLAQNDLYMPKEWSTRLDSMASEDGVVIPEKLAGLIPTAYGQKELNDRRDAYAGDLARKVRQSFPTHVIQRMLEKNDLSLGPQHDDMKEPVQSLLKNAANKGFQLGRTPVEQFLQHHGESLFDGFTKDNKRLAEDGVKLLTRVYQMTPSDDAMAKLLELGFTSARQVASIPKAAFIERYAQDFGSQAVTDVVWDKSVQITSSTFNIYTLAKKVDSAPTITAITGATERHENAKSDLKLLLKDYPTMESLFDSMDYCECEHCRSVLSPAAYLVDLLRFVDPSEQDWEHTLKDWEKNHNGKTYANYNYLKPYEALIKRRPDIPYLPLTCENTNTAMPYIDLVNEILEYYVANRQIDAKAVRDTGEATSAELIAEPQNIIPLAYETLKDAIYPLSLPFDLWLETVRRFCDYFETPFWKVLDSFRPSHELFVPVEEPKEAYYRVHIFSEYLGLTPDEYALYTAPNIASWPRLYGYDVENGIEAIAILKSAKMLSRRLDVTYKELIELVQTEFVNPRLHTLVTLRKLGLDLQEVFRYKKHPEYEPLKPEEEEEFERCLTELTEKFGPHSDVALWLQHSREAGDFEQIVVLKDLDNSGRLDQQELRYADGSEVDASFFLKLNVFVRLWKRLGWTMEETDLALTTFCHLPVNEEITDVKLGNAMQTALVYLAHLKELSERLQTGKDSRIKLLMLWSERMPTKGKNSLYAQLFLTRNILKEDAVFDDPLDNYLSDPKLFLADHLPAIQAALNVTADEIALILKDSNKDEERDIHKAKLLLTNISTLYRYGLLAKALKLSISELIILKALSGLNPFHPLSPNALSSIEDDYPLEQTLDFVRLVQEVKGSAFTVSDLNYLFRHRMDPNGSYREDGSSKDWIRLSAAQLRAIAADFAVPDNAASVSDDELRQKMGMAFAPDVVEQLLDKAVYSATKEHVLPTHRLDPAIYGNNGVNVSYDDIRQQQKVTYTGVLTAADKTALLAAIPEPLPGEQDSIAARQMYSELLDEISINSSAQFEVFFSKNFDGPLKFNELYGDTVNLSRDAKRQQILATILPLLQAKLTRKAIVQAMTLQTGGDPTLIETLMTNENFLALPNATDKSILSILEGLSQRGFSVKLNPSDTEDLIQTIGNIELLDDDERQEVVWEGFIEVPQEGEYRFYAKLGMKAAKVELSIDQTTVAFTQGGIASEDGEELFAIINLKPGVLYDFHLTATNLQKGSFQLLIKGETTPKAQLSKLVVTIPKAVCIGAERAYTMTAKALQLVLGLGLSEREVRHILTNPSDFGGVNWRLLPTEKQRAREDSGEEDQDEQAFAAAVASFSGFRPLIHYASLKRALAGGGDDLIAIFEYARLRCEDNEKDSRIEELCERIATLTRRQGSEVQLAAAELKMKEPVQFADEELVGRLWQALQIVERFGISVSTLKKWLTSRPDATVAMNIRRTVKARFEPETWQRFARAIFDPLRQRQRDALVAYIMHTNEQLVSVEKLFEYFLIDPGTEPVVQTSRLRLAISSVQTFIQRCFLNLEPSVHPSVLNAQHWSWMKRYRLWEANRKIFLYPENWLEPEWRDDKTHLFQELESSLLQGDVTNQLAEDALYVYLKKLDQLARLEIVTMYVEEKPLGPPTIHVIGRTYMSPRQYFYRSYAHHMWTPWEPVTADIDGDHLVAVVWRERLHLFWLTFMEKVEESTTGPTINEKSPLGETPLTTLINNVVTVSKGAVNRSLDIQLSWSEYFQGEWSVRESSGFGNTITSQPFLASEVFVTVSKEEDSDAGTDAVRIHLNGLEHDFKLTSKNGVPQFGPTSLSTAPSPYSVNETSFNRYKGETALAVSFVQQVVTTDGVTQADPRAPHTIMSNIDKFTILQASNPMSWPNEEFAPLVSPVFYADDRHTFFVEPSLTETTVKTWQGYIHTEKSLRPRWNDFILHPPHDLFPVIPPKYNQVFVKQPQPRPELMRSVSLYSIKPNVDAQTQPNIAMQFGDVIIGAKGRIQETEQISHVITSAGGSINLRNRGAK